MGTTIRYLEPIVSPRSKLHATSLVVEGEVGDVNLAGAAQLGGGRPEHYPLVRHHRLALHETLREVIRAEHNKKKDRKDNFCLVESVF